MDPENWLVARTLERDSEAALAAEQALEAEYARELARQPAQLSAAEIEVAELVRAGPSLAEHGVIRWRRRDLAGVIERRFGVVLGERSVGAMLKRLGFRRLSTRPRHPGHDAQAQASCRPTSPPS